jgi:hypothetical protein
VRKLGRLGTACEGRWNRVKVHIVDCCSLPQSAIGRMKRHVKSTSALNFTIHRIPSNWFSSPSHVNRFNRFMDETPSPQEYQSRNASRSVCFYQLASQNISLGASPKHHIYWRSLKTSSPSPSFTYRPHSGSPLRPPRAIRQYLWNAEPRMVSIVHGLLLLGC